MPPPHILPCGLNFCYFLWIIFRPLNYFLSVVPCATKLGPHCIWVWISGTLNKLLLECNAPTTMRCFNKDRGPFRISLFCGWGVLPILGKSAMTLRKVDCRGLGVLSLVFLKLDLLLEGAWPLFEDNTVRVTESPGSGDSTNAWVELLILQLVA